MQGAKDLKRDVFVKKKKGKRRDSRYYCQKCPSNPGLCVNKCIKDFFFFLAFPLVFKKYCIVPLNYPKEYVLYSNPTVLLPNFTPCQKCGRVLLFQMGKFCGRFWVQCQKKFTLQFSAIDGQNALSCSRALPCSHQATNTCMVQLCIGEVYCMFNAVFTTPSLFLQNTSPNLPLLKNVYSIYVVLLPVNSEKKMELKFTLHLLQQISTGVLF